MGREDGVFNQVEIVSSGDALELIGRAGVSPAQRQFMELTVKEGTAFWHDFGDGPVCILDVSSFFNHGVKVPLLASMGRSLAEDLGEVDASVALTVASGGNILTYELCRQLGIGRMVYARKKPTVIHKRNGVWQARATSYTGGYPVDLSVARGLLGSEDRVLWADDFVDRGSTTASACSIIEQAGARLVGCAYGVNKVYAGGVSQVEKLMGRFGLAGDRLVSFLSIIKMDEGVVQFGGFDVGFRLARQEG